MPEVLTLRNNKTPNELASVSPSQKHNVQGIETDYLALEDRMQPRSVRGSYKIHFQYSGTIQTTFVNATSCSYQLLK